MQRIKCEACGVEHPKNDIFSVFNHNFCKPCGEAQVKDRDPSQIPEGSIYQLTDPTVCARCGADNGSLELPIVVGAPVCDRCEHALRHYPFPRWVKLAALLVLALVSFEMVRNWRLFQAYFEIPRADQAADAGDFHRAADLARQAADHLPERPQLATKEQFYRAMALAQEQKFDEASALLNKLIPHAPPKEADMLRGLVDEMLIAQHMAADRYEDAIPLIEKYKKRHPGDSTGDDLLRSCRIGKAFDAKDYDTFLALAQETVRVHDKDAQSHAQLASALACKYATTNDASFRKQAEAEMETARKLAAGDPALREYEERILHRLDSREIITKKEYDRRFRSATTKAGAQ